MGCVILWPWLVQPTCHFMPCGLSYSHATKCKFNGDLFKNQRLKEAEAKLSILERYVLCHYRQYNVILGYFLRASSFVYYPIFGVRYFYRKVPLHWLFFLPYQLFEILEEMGPISHCWPSKGLVFLKTHSSVANWQGNTVVSNSEIMIFLHQNHAEGTSSKYSGQRGTDFAGCVVLGLEQPQPYKCQTLLIHFQGLKCSWFCGTRIHLV